MNRSTKVISIVVLLIFAGSLGMLALMGRAFRAGGSENGGSLFSGRVTVNLWYTDDALSDYINEKAVSYNNSQSACRIEPKLCDGVEFLEEVNRESLQNTDDCPDLYCLSNESLGKAVLAGLTSPIDSDPLFGENSPFPETAEHAVRYEDSYVAYPFYFETAALLYNTGYLQQMADSAGISLDEAVPETILDVISLANSFDAPEEVSGIFSWDVNDIFFNYYFLGDSIDVGGPDGDDPDEISIYNDAAVQSLQIFQQLSQFFSIDSSAADYENQIDDFIHGKTVFVAATSDVLRTLEKTDAYEGDYGVVRLPDLTDSLMTRSMSVTQCLVVNGYSLHRQEAQDFADYLLNDSENEFFERSGKLLAQSADSCSDAHAAGFYEGYYSSDAIPKMRETSNFWMYLENAFSKVWDGNDPNDALKDVAQQMMIQITGDDTYVLDRIDDPEKIDINSLLEDGD